MEIPAFDAQIWDTVRTAVDTHEPRDRERGDLWEAAVLIALVPHGHDPHVVLTVRTSDVEHHKGEISFPGGGRDPEDGDLVQTALREAHEEVGIDPAHVEVVGRMSHFVTRSNFHVTPYVGIVDRAPYVYQPSAIEVAEVLEIPLSHLYDPATHEHDAVEYQGQTFQRRTYRYGDHAVWGATAFMLRDFLETLGAHLGVAH